MIRGVQYSNEAPATRYVDITWMGEKSWRVHLWSAEIADTVWRTSLTSAQATARKFIASGHFPRT